MRSTKAHATEESPRPGSVTVPCDALVAASCRASASTLLPDWTLARSNPAEDAPFPASPDPDPVGQIGIGIHASGSVLERVRIGSMTIVSSSLMARGARLLLEAWRTSSRPTSAGRQRSDGHSQSPASSSSSTPPAELELNHDRDSSARPNWTNRPSRLPRFCPALEHCPTAPAFFLFPTMEACTSPRPASPRLHSIHAKSHDRDHSSEPSSAPASTTPRTPLTPRGTPGVETSIMLPPL
ncbi:uncharacterized protein PAN0_008d3381 [Moesziomyces antarcticus]|uniref:Uncharacterized protein n=1 Tax=Pseudozyma antarctica TaxID=84753 RepID=A0A081CER8_PSEA2|nr:uncharacterized protein PAN0_008d3381 [Moesziomyces antarcticus]GAK65164.1 hypothetical protein PAN0_008d3381 [Moesziomyces antarcticus]